MDSEKFPLVFVGHVDHGKSTIIGRLLHETGNLPDGKLAAIKSYCETNSRPFEYAFLIDALKDEQAQGITIDTARVFFKTKKRDFVIIDAPGHIEFLKNMITGASRAEAAFLVIAADEGIMENSRRHGYMLSMLGIRQVVVLVNKMDLVGFSEEVFRRIESEFTAFAGEIGISPLGFVPVSGIRGTNLKLRDTENTPWYNGKTLYEFLDIFEEKSPRREQPFRMFLQDIYRFTESDDNRRIYAGTISSGTVRRGDELVFYPSGKRSRIAQIEAFNSPEIVELSAGNTAGFTLTEQIYATRGELLTRADEPKPPHVGRRFRAAVFWLWEEPLSKSRSYTIKLGTARTTLRLVEITKLIDTSSLDLRGGGAVGKFEAAECLFETGREIAFDTIEENQECGRFVIVCDYEIRGGGIILEAFSEDTVTSSEVSSADRVNRFGNSAALLIVKNNFALAAALESALFRQGALTCLFSDINPIKNPSEIKILLRTGMLVILNSSTTFESSFFEKFPCFMIENETVEEILTKLRKENILR
ncbi:50S ribosome-binding GTPase [bacterium]|nr:50S ribosome-binding GTPase [bacterium]